MTALRARMKESIGSANVSSDTKGRCKASSHFVNSRDVAIKPATPNAPTATAQSHAWIAISEALASYEPIRLNGDKRKRHEMGVHKVQAYRMARPTGHNFQVRARQESKIARKQSQAAQ